MEAHKFNLNKFVKFRGTNIVWLVVMKTDDINRT